ncbi:PAS domain S-box-containing protein [Desulfotomaculum arcticum]|uniref:histidine kinase n=1 Tax=Desulfotruncus arcticus DSM 17038 TaxID=1121424 RepID=A0A1I2V9I5_9FIRM|nr:PAS domain S-box-containing protein [Desulfotomaculum arcticum] [Desulfotruncus arcticus DSM 17038]
MVQVVILNSYNKGLTGLNKKLLDLKQMAFLKQNDAEINQRELFLRTMLEALPVACYVVDDRTDDIIYFNSLFCDIWGIRQLEAGMRNGILKNGDIVRHCAALAANAPAYIESCVSLQDLNNRSTIHDEIQLKDNRVINRLAVQLWDVDDNYWGRLYVFGDITRPKEIERSLKESEQKYQQLFFNSPAAKLIVDPENGNIVDANRAAIRFYGYPASELQSMTVYDINPGDPAEIARSIQSVREPDGDHFHFKHRLSNGEVRDVEVYSGRINVSGKKLNSAIIFDVTEKLRAEEELLESRERLSLVIESARAGIWDYDVINNRMYYDQQWKTILGYQEDEFSDSPEEWLSRIHPDDVDKVCRARRDLMTGKTDKFQIEHRLRHKNGSYRWILARGKMIFDRAKRPLRWVGSNIDITIQKEVEALRLESEKRLKEFARAMPDTSFIIDEDGRYVEIFGNNVNFPPISREKFKGHTIHQLLDQELADTLLNEIRQTIVTGRQRSLVFQMDLGQKEKIAVEGRLAPMSYLNDGKKTVAVSLTNITERRKAEKMLQFTYNLQRKSDFFNDIISGQGTMDKKIMATAENWGIDLTRPLFCCLVQIDKATGLHKNDQDNLTDFQCPKNNIIALLSDDEEYVLWDNRDHIGIFCYSVDTADEWLVSMQAAKRIREKISSYIPGLIITIGVSRMHSGLRSLGKSYEEARSAIIAAKCQGEKNGTIIHYRDIGFYQLIATCEIEHTGEYVQRNIGPLIKYDREKGAGFLQTLEVILESNNLKDAAQRIFLHYKTLAYRKKRIEEILGVSIDQFETRLTLATAIKLHKLNSLEDN